MRIILQNISNMFTYHTSLEMYSDRLSLRAFKSQEKKLSYKTHYFFFIPPGIVAGTVEPINDRLWPSFISAVVCFATIEGMLWDLPCMAVLDFAARAKFNSISRFDTFIRIAVAKSEAMVPPSSEPDPPSCWMHCSTGWANSRSTQHSERPSIWSHNCTREAAGEWSSTSRANCKGSLW